LDSILIDPRGVLLDFVVRMSAMDKGRHLSSRQQPLGRVNYNLDSQHCTPLDNTDFQDHDISESPGGRFKEWQDTQQLKLADQRETNQDNSYDYLGQPIQFDDQEEYASQLETVYPGDTRYDDMSPSILGEPDYYYYYNGDYLMPGHYNDEVSNSGVQIDGYCSAPEIGGSPGLETNSAAFQPCSTTMSGVVTLPGVQRGSRRPSRLEALPGRDVVPDNQSSPSRSTGPPGKGQLKRQVAYTTIGIFFN
jgi:hypothetical protein